MKYYRSSIPKTARERVVSTYAGKPQKYKVECVLKRTVIGIRYFHETGELESEWPLNKGLVHGIVYRADVPGKLTSAEPYCNGLPHGTEKQYSHDGKIIGTYTMRHGTGIDLWWCESSEHGTFLSEARYVKDGKRHGFEWWLTDDQKGVWEERHFSNGKLHGIERAWNNQGRLRRGYPRYWVHDKRVSKRQYLRESANDPALPPFRVADNHPPRRFPPEIMRHTTRQS